jgi:hypothetical protein
MIDLTRRRDGCLYSRSLSGTSGPDIFKLAEVKASAMDLMNPVDLASMQGLREVYGLPIFRIDG